MVKIKRLIKKWWQSVVIGTILGMFLVFGVIKYQTDQDGIHGRISGIQQQQELVIMGTNNPLPILIKKAMPSVVFVEAPGLWTGSGVIVGPHTVLTAGHVIEDTNGLVVETIDGRKYESIATVRSKVNDCGLIFFDPRESFTNIAEFADFDKVEVGDVIFTLGSPYGKELFNTATFGIISGLDRRFSYFGECGLLTSDAAGNPGNSGGPIFDMQGRIVGIVVGSRYGSEGLNIITPGNVCEALLKNKKVDIDE